MDDVGGKTVLATIARRGHRAGRQKHADLQHAQLFRSEAAAANTLADAGANESRSAVHAAEGPRFMPPARR